MKKLLIFVLTIGCFSMSARALEVGDIAPDFSLEGTDGEVHRLSDYRGERAVVLAWFPKAYTRGCTIECKSLAENGHLIRAFDVAYYMVSVDPIEKNVGFAEQQQADFPLLSDPTKQTARAYNVLSDRGYAVRHTYYIGVDGRVIGIDKQVKPATSAEDIATTLGKLGVAPAEESAD